MQQRKTNWKKLRRETPCRHCGQAHATGQCPTTTRAGRPRHDPTPHHWPIFILG